MKRPARVTESEKGTAKREARRGRAAHSHVRALQQHMHPAPFQDEEKLGLGRTGLVPRSQQAGTSPGLSGPGAQRARLLAAPPWLGASPFSGSGRRVLSLLHPTLGRRGRGGGVGPSEEGYVGVGL